MAPVARGQEAHRSWPAVVGRWRATTAAALGILIIVLLGVTIRVRGNGPLRLDSWWHDLMLAWRGDAGLAIARAFAVMGGVTPMIFFGVGIVLAFLIATKPRYALAVATAMLTSEVVTRLLKGLVRPSAPRRLRWPTSD